jgi:hypothetical protein
VLARYALTLDFHEGCTMGLIRYYVAVSERQLEEISKDYDDYEEAVDDVVIVPKNNRS